jgi:hypothetical protein
VIESALFELAIKCGTVGLGGAAPEIFHVIGRHVTMLAHRPDDGFAAARPERTVRPKNRWCDNVYMVQADTPRFC